MSSFVRRKKDKKVAIVAADDVSSEAAESDATAAAGHGAAPATVSGTRPSAFGAGLLVSLGMPAVDALVGGGVALGTMVVVAEGETSQHAHHVMRYMAAEGLASAHRVVVVGPEAVAKRFVEGIPQLVRQGDGDAAGATQQGTPAADAKKKKEEEDDDIEEDDEEETNDKDGVGLKIAWRYKSYVRFRAGGADRSTQHVFDMSKAAVDAASRVTVVPFGPGGYTDVLDALQPMVEECTRTGTVCRVLFPSFMSTYWTAVTCHAADHDADDAGHAAAAEFVQRLHRMLRPHHAISCLSMPVEQQTESFVRRMEHRADLALVVEPFSGCGLHKLESQFPGFHGMLHFRKLPRVNTVECPGMRAMSSLSYVYRVRRKKFVVEQLHLPPEGLDQSAPASRFSSTKKVSAASTAAKALDF